VANVLPLTPYDGNRSNIPGSLCSTNQTQAKKNHPIMQEMMKDYTLGSIVLKDYNIIAVDLHKQIDPTRIGAKFIQILTAMAPLCSNQTPR
jgi:hypothetical protein